MEIKSGNKSFTIVLKTKYYTPPAINKNVTADIIYGFHQYNNGNEIFESSMSFQSTTLMIKNQQFLVWVRFQQTIMNLMGQYLTFQK